MQLLPGFSLKEMLEHCWVLTLAHMGLEKSGEMLAALFQAYLHKFFSMQDVPAFLAVVETLNCVVVAVMEGVV